MAWQRSKLFTEMDKNKEEMCNIYNRFYFVEILVFGIWRKFEWVLISKMNYCKYLNLISTFDKKNSCKYVCWEN